MAGTPDPDRRLIRLLRDATSLARPSYLELELELETILGEHRYPDFTALWYLLHASRADPPSPAEPRRKTSSGTTDSPSASLTASTIWERWRDEGIQAGTRVREGLHDGVKQALALLGEGFLAHSANTALREALIGGALTDEAFFNELIRLIYRCIFLFVIEERQLLHVHDNSPEAVRARRIYAEGYGAARLRERCRRRIQYDQHDDL